MKKFNKEMLFEDILFPLNWDGIYIWDDANHMVANVFDKPIADKIIGAYKEEVENPETEDTKEFANIEGDFIKRNTGEKFGFVRGWGRLQYKDKAEERQDNIAKYLINCLNLKT